MTRLLEASNKAPTECARLQLFGEYLHAYEDTFAHRTKQNEPFGVNSGFGHGLSGSNPDYTYSDYLGDAPIVQANSWVVRPERTLRMEEEVFAKLTAWGDPAKAKSWDEVRAVVAEFNAIEEDEDHIDPSLNPDGLNEKINLLNKILQKWDYQVTNDDGTTRNINLLKDDQYDPTDGGKNRNEYLCDEKNQRLKETDYPGTTLPVTECPT